MSIADDARRALESHPEMIELYRGTSPGDRSIHYMLLDTEDAAAITSGDSPNHRLWVLWEALGWVAIEERDLPDLPVKLEMLECKLTEMGRRAIPVAIALLLEAEAAQRDA